MSKIELIYSQQSGDFIKGRAYSNPRFFTTPRTDVSKVFLVGEWPNIRAAYEAQGVPVEQIDEGKAVAAEPVERRAPADLTPAAPAPQRGEIHIPDDWRDLPYRGGADVLTLRQLAALVSDEPVINKAQAVAAVEAELRRRHADEEGPNGLTRREMNADLEAAGIEPDPTLSIEELADLAGMAKE
ncbi:hypothetical protein [Phenylobacterium kunshanense]|uniref:Uncharacterized protein n=1 Tax=Phenylobacterium kunshanense TaxID=1445034 RepID=A0A328BNY6_9CAUL|nr:hypothetical protein [Phenylobacterium kunshanense]RAK68813.1 hypothetical protein DJ019_02020 [Phenylobacterium kunshanense]